MMLTSSAKPSEVKRSWYVLDLAQSQDALGRHATQVAKVLRGKHKPGFSTHIDTGDYVVIINTAKAKVTGSKPKKKLYQWHTGFPGGIREATFEKMLERDPNKVVYLAIKRMLPRGPLGRAMLKKLKLYSDAKHEHVAQAPKCFVEHFLTKQDDK